MVICKELEVFVDKERSGYFSELLDKNKKIFGYYEVLFDKENEKTSIFELKTKFKIYLNVEDEESEILILLYLKILEEPIEIKVKILQSFDYQESYKKFYKLFSVGIFDIVPTWDKRVHVNKRNKISLFINPGLAFGTGHHETTQLMLTQISSIDLKCKNILDIGTGSGILSLACAKKLAKNVLALDIDENSVAAAKYNLEQNEIKTNFEVYVGSFDFDLKNRDFDFLLININLNIILRNIHWIEKMKIKRILFSGILQEEENKFLKILQSKLQGNLLDSKKKNGWLLIDWFRN